ncbi:MAG: PqqD family protein [Bacteroidota bacterium]
MAYQNNDIIKISGNVLSSQLGDESVILDHQHGLYFGLDNVGSFVWEKIQEKEMTVAEVKEAVMLEFEADEATVESDLTTLFNQLKEENLIL